MFHEGFLNLIYIAFFNLALYLRIFAYAGYSLQISGS